MAETRKPRNIVMWLKSTDDHSMSHFRNSKAKAYHEFFRRLSERDNLRFAFDADSYKGDGMFENVAVYKDGEITSTGESFRADAIYQFNKLAALDFASPPPITNTPAFRNFCNPKINAYGYMPQFFPKTYLATSKNELAKAAEKIKAEKVVVKPNKGSSGDMVFVFEKNNLDFDAIPAQRLSDEGFLVQEFVDTVAGIPGITPGYHDLRIVTHGDRISLCHVRVPPAGSFVGNTHKGATVAEVDIDSIPGFIMDFYKKVHAEVSKKYPKPLYSMDLGVGPDGPKLFELNSHTAFPWDHFKCMDRFIDNLIYHLETIS